LTIVLEKGDAADLSAVLRCERVDLIFHPCSNCLYARTSHTRFGASDFRVFATGQARLLAGFNIRCCKFRYARRSPEGVAGLNTNYVFEEESLSEKGRDERMPRTTPARHPSTPDAQSRANRRRFTSPVLLRRLRTDEARLLNKTRANF
jgi:hypothetical protein